MCLKKMSSMYDSCVIVTVMLPMDTECPVAWQWSPSVVGLCVL